MSNLESLQAELTLKLAEIDSGLTREQADKRAYFDIRNLIGNVPVPEVIRKAVRGK